MGNRFHSRRSILGILCLVGLLSPACSRSPQAESAKYLETGKKLLQNNDPSRAILQFRNAARAMPKSAEAYYQLGLAYLAAGDSIEGVKALRKAIELNPKHVAAQLRLAQLMAMVANPDTLKDAQQRLLALLQGAPGDPEALHALALTELKLGEPKDAIEHLAQAIAAAPQNVSIALTLAEVKQQQNDLKGAEEILKQACERAPNSADAAVILGRFYASHNRTAEAEQQFRRGVSIDPHSGLALFNLAALQDLTGRKQDAEESYKRVSMLPGRNFKPVLAMFLFQERRYQEAVREFEKLAKEDPEDRLARTRLVAAYRSVSRASDAEKVLSAALKKNPKDLEALLQRGEMLIEAGRYGQAEGDLNQVIHLQPNSAEAHYILAKLHQSKGEDGIYRAELSRALELAPYLTAVRLELAQALLRSNPQSAMAVMDETPSDQKQLIPVLVQRNWVLWTVGNMAEMRKGIDVGLARQRSADLLVQDGLWKLRNGNPAAARSALDEALKMNPSDLLALRALTQTYLSQKNPSLALQKIKEYASAQPNSAPVQHFLGEFLMAEGDRTGARAAFAAAKTASPQFQDADLSLARLDFTDKKFDDAAKRLDEVVSANPKEVTPRLWLAVIDEIKGDNKAAAAGFRKVLEQDPNQPQALNNLAYMIAESGGDLDEALKYSQQAVKIDPQRPDYSDTLGWILYRKGIYGAAIQYLEKGSSDSKTVVGKYHLAMAYARAGDQRRGRATLEAALKINANVPEAKAAQEVIGQSH